MPYVLVRERTHLNLLPPQHKAASELCNVHPLKLQQSIKHEMHYPQTSGDRVRCTYEKFMIMIMIMTMIMIIIMIITLIMAMITKMTMPMPMSMRMIMTMLTPMPKPMVMIMIMPMIMTMTTTMIMITAAATAIQHGARRVKITNASALRVLCED